jgi:hypothetical protein
MRNEASKNDRKTLGNPSGVRVGFLYSLAQYVTSNGKYLMGQRDHSEQNHVLITEPNGPDSAGDWLVQKHEAPMPFF